MVAPEDMSDTSSTTATSSSSRQFKPRTKLSEMADRKVVIVPVVYMLLKFWGIGVNIGIYFVSTHARTTYRENALSSVLVFISVSIHLCYAEGWYVHSEKGTYSGHTKSVASPSSPLP